MGTTVWQICQKDYQVLTDAELAIEKKKLKKAKITAALLIGFLAGILIFGVVSWLLSPNKQLGFFIPMLIPVFFIYRMLKNSKKNAALEQVLKERNIP